MAMEIFKLVGSIFVDSKDAENSIQKTSDKTESLGSKMASGVKTAAKWGAAITGAAVGVGAAMIASAKSTASNLDTIDKGSKRMKISAESYQKLSHAASLCGVEMSTMEKAAKKLEGTDINFDDALEEIMSYGTEAERTAAAIDLFGESIAYSLSPMLAESTESFSAMKQEAEDLGLVMSNETVAAGATLNDSFTKIGEVVSSLGTQIGVALMPYVQGILDWVLEHMPEIQGFIGGVIEGITGFINDFIAGCEQMGIDWGTIWEGIRTVITFVGAVISKTVQGIVWMIQGVITVIKEVMGWFNTYNQAVKDYGVDGYWVETESGSYWVPVAGNNATNNPNNTVSGSSSTETGYPSSYETPNRKGGSNKFTAMADGGVVDSPIHALIGEAGSEAVIPLENNTGWISRVAESMNGALGGSEVSAKLDRLIELFERGSRIYLDGRTLVGGIAENMNEELGNLAIVNGRVG